AIWQQCGRDRARVRHDPLNSKLVMREEKYSNVPAVVAPESRRTNVAPLPYSTPPPYFGDGEPDTPTVPLSHYLWIIKRYRWRILAFVTTCVLATFIVSK